MNIELARLEAEYERGKEHGRAEFAEEIAAAEKRMIAYYEEKGRKQMKDKILADMKIVKFFRNKVARRKELEAIIQSL